jgi:hypothetical protein
MFEEFSFELDASLWSLKLFVAVYEDIKDGFWSEIFFFVIKTLGLYPNSDWIRIQQQPEYGPSKMSGSVTKGDQRVILMKQSFALA